MLALAGDVAGRRILDAGCGSGPLSAELRDRGAIMSGFDKSAGMLRLARKRLGPDVSVNHPIQGHPIVRPGADYWSTYEWSDEITTASGQSYTLANWHRPCPR
jgi:SAM-dependent methyltransferase